MCMQQMHKIYVADQQLIGTAGKFWEKQTLRKVTIFRALHYPYEQDKEGGVLSRKNDVMVRRNVPNQVDMPTSGGTLQPLSRMHGSSNSVRRMLKTKSSTINTPVRD